MASMVLVVLSRVFKPEPRQGQVTPMVGVKTTMVLGKHSGRHAVQKRAEELGYTLSRFELDRAYRKMIALADRQKHVSDAELQAIIEEMRAEERERDRDRQAEADACLMAPGGGAEMGYGHGV